MLVLSFLSYLAYIAYMFQSYAHHKQLPLYVRTGLSITFLYSGERLCMSTPAYVTVSLPSAQSTLIPWSTYSIKTYTTCHINEWIAISQRTYVIIKLIYLLSACANHITKLRGITSNLI